MSKNADDKEIEYAYDLEGEIELAISNFSLCSAASSSGRMAESMVCLLGSAGGALCQLTAGCRALVLSFKFHEHEWKVTRGLLPRSRRGHGEITREEARRRFEKVRDGVVPNMYGDMTMSDPCFWSQPHIDPVDPSPQVLARAPSAGLWSFEPVRDFYLLRRIYLVCPSLLGITPLPELRLAYRSRRRPPPPASPASPGSRRLEVCSAAEAPPPP